MNTILEKDYDKPYRLDGDFKTIKVLRENIRGQVDNLVISNKEWDNANNGRRPAWVANLRFGIFSKYSPNYAEDFPEVTAYIKFAGMDIMSYNFGPSGRYIYYECDLHYSIYTDYTFEWYNLQNVNCNVNMTVWLDLDKED